MPVAPTVEWRHVLDVAEDDCAGDLHWQHDVRCVVPSISEGELAGNSCTNQNSEGGVDYRGDFGGGGGDAGDINFSGPAQGAVKNC